MSKFRVISLYIFLHVSFYNGYTYIDHDKQYIKLRLGPSLIRCLYLNFVWTFVTSSNDVITFIFFLKLLPLFIFQNFNIICPKMIELCVISSKRFFGNRLFCFQTLNLIDKIKYDNRKVKRSCHQCLLCVSMFVCVFVCAFATAYTIWPRELKLGQVGQE